MFKPKDRYSPRSKQPRGIRDRYTALGDPAGMGSAPQSKIAHGFISASSLARVSPRPIAPKFRSVGTSTMPIRSRQPTNQQTTINQLTTINHQPRTPTAALQLSSLIPCSPLQSSVFPLPISFPRASSYGLLCSRLLRASSRSALW